MATSRGKRFSLLLLEEREQYFCDAAVVLYAPPAAAAAAEHVPRIGARPTAIAYGQTTPRRPLARAHAHTHTHIYISRIIACSLFLHSPATPFIV